MFGLGPTTAALPFLNCKHLGSCKISKKAYATKLAQNLTKGFRLTLLHKDFGGLMQQSWPKLQNKQKAYATKLARGFFGGWKPMAWAVGGGGVGGARG